MSTVTDKPSGRPIPTQREFVADFSDPTAGAVAVSRELASEQVRMIADPAPSYAEISEALDMPIGSIGPTRQRCLAALRAQAVAAGITMDLG